MTSLHPTLKLSADMSAVESVLAELTARLPELAPEVCERLVGLVERFSDLFVVESNLYPTLGADHLRVVARPTEGLVVLMSALRTGNVDLAIIEQAFGHNGSSLETAQHNKTGGA